jgi:hypothetical protein
MLTFPRTSDAEYFSVLEELYPSSSVVIGELPRDTEIIALLKAESATNVGCKTLQSADLCESEYCVQRSLVADLSAGRMASLR